MDLAEHYYDDNFDYYEEKSRHGIMESATTEPVRTFLHGKDSEEKDKAFQKWDNLRLERIEEAERKNDVDPWLKTINDSEERMKAMVRRLNQKQVNRMEGLQSKVTAMNNKVDLMLRVLLEQKHTQQEDQARNGNQHG